MSNKSQGTPGTRLRHLRREVMGITQRAMAEELGVARSLIPAMESGKQGVSKATAQKLYELWGINMAWLLMGEGELRAEGIEAASAPNTNASMSQNMRNDAWRLFMDVECFIDGRCGNYGYAGLSGTKLRIHAGRDAAIANTRLFQIVEDDTLWIAAGEPSGWEFEVLRAYFESYTDRSLPEWMECLRMIRWIHRVIQTAPAVAEFRERRTA